MHKGLIRSFIDSLYGSTPTEFKSSFSLEESVARLKDARKAFVYQALRSQQMVGKVSESSVRLQRVIPFVGNSFKPFFFGSFHQVNGETVLSGTFTMHWFVKIFMSIWFGGCFLWTCLALISILSSGENWFMPLFGVAMLLGGYALVRSGQWFCRNDIAWMSERISGALRLGASS